MDVEEIKSVFASWNQKRLGAAGIRFAESSNAPLGSGDDYRVVYEAVFEPDDLDKIRIEIWLTDTGHTAVWLEKCSRVSKRLAKKFSRGGAVAGHEPIAMSSETLNLLFGVAVGGKLLIAVRSIFHVGLTMTPFLPTADYEAIRASGYSYLRGPQSAQSGVFSSILPLTVLDYRPW
ncbi:hypothetical protein [Bradyrhizobium sp. WD16]|uniref:hypothetical protein n=1 Tax=Bradyrhizobium sp. WD16 TaxID=1521768 RepID=UPI0020A536F3|nr:hypothetical protein [Bradyrhizobium sp. WD16]